MKLLILVFSFSLFISCVSFPFMSVRDDFKFNPEKEEGLLLYSISRSGNVQAAPWIELFFKNDFNKIFHKDASAGILTEGKDPTIFHLGGFEFTKENPNTHLNLLTVPISEYSFINWLLLAANGDKPGYKLYAMPLDLFDIKINPKKNKIIYIGNIHINFIKDETASIQDLLLGTKDFYWEMEIKDDPQDIINFQKNYPTLSKLELMKDVKPVKMKEKYKIFITRVVKLNLFLENCRGWQPDSGKKKKCFFE